MDKCHGASADKATEMREHRQEKTSAENKQQLDSDREPRIHCCIGLVASLKEAGRLEAMQKPDLP